MGAMAIAPLVGAAAAEELPLTEAEAETEPEWEAEAEAEPEAAELERAAEETLEGEGGQREGVTWHGKGGNSRRGALGKGDSGEGGDDEVGTGEHGWESLQRGELAVWDDEEGVYLRCGRRRRWLRTESWGGC